VCSSVIGVAKVAVVVVHDSLEEGKTAIPSLQKHSLLQMQYYCRCAWWMTVALPCMSYARSS
jgi:hypothetical protein